ncbi:MAG: RND family transporter [Planctomycetota bacterium]
MAAPFADRVADALLRRHRLVLPLALLGFTIYCAIGLQYFSLDAAAESLTLKNDGDLAFYNETRRNLNSDEYVIVSLSLADDQPGDWLTPDRVAYVKQLAAAFLEVPTVAKVESVLGLPLFHSPPPLPQQEMEMVRANVMMALMKQQQLAEAFNHPVTLASGRADLALARAELTQHCVAVENYISPDARTLQLQVFIQENAFGHFSNDARQRLRDRRDELIAAGTGGEELATVERTLRGLEDQYLLDYSTFGHLRRVAVEGVTAIVEAQRAEHGGEYVFRLSGLPTLVEEMVDSLGHDMLVFGATSAGFVLLVLMLMFRRVRWVVVPLVIGAMVVVWILGLMSHQHIRITLVTVNIASLLFIVTMAHSIHMVVRCRELQVRARERGETPDPVSLLRETLTSLWWPCLFTALTTCVGFASLFTSQIAPVMEFGFWMAIGTMVALFASFLAFPAVFVLIGLPSPPTPREAGKQPVLRAFAAITLRGYRVIPVLGLAVVVVAVLGMQKLQVEMKLIDYFKAASPTHQGLKFIDREMGGTTTLEVIIESGEEGYFHKFQSLEALRPVMDQLDAHHSREIGNVISALSFMDEVKRFVPHDFARALALQMTRETLLHDYISPDGKRARIVARVRETIPDLDRGALLTGVTNFLAAQFPADGPLKAKVTGIFVLYTNMLNSLIVSQQKSLGVVGISVTIMLAVLFLSPVLAIIGMVPNVVPVLLVLGVMGLAAIPLNIVTVMIASVALGIGVDGTIHYVARYRKELAATDGDFEAALRRSHQSIGLAILATSFAIIGGTWLMMLSDFVPTIWFGLFTGLALLASLFGALTILPSFLLLLRPFGKWRRLERERRAGARADVPAGLADRS